MYVASTLIDAGGHKTDYVYRFTAQREWRNVFASIGKAGIGRPIASRPRETKKSAMIGASVVPVGVDTAKDQLFDWLTKERICAGYCHFPRNDEYNNEFFAQLTAEKRVKHYVRGNLVWGYEKTRERNEALDRRIQHPVMQGNTLVADIDGVPMVLTVSDVAVDAYCKGALPLNTLCNAVLRAWDHRQELASQHYEEGVGEEQEIVRSRSLQ